MKMSRSDFIDVVENVNAVCLIACKITPKKEFIKSFDSEEEPDFDFLSEGNVSIELTEEVEKGQHITLSDETLKPCDPNSESFGVVVGDSKEGTPVIHLLRGAVIFKE